MKSFRRKSKPSARRRLNPTKKALMGSMKKRNKKAPRRKRTAY